MMTQELTIASTLEHCINDTILELETNPYHHDRAMPYVNHIIKVIRDEESKGTSDPMTYEQLMYQTLADFNLVRPLKNWLLIRIRQWSDSIL